VDTERIPPAGDPFHAVPAYPPAEDHDDTVEAHYASLERPHACNDGWVTIGQIVVDP